jgi:hypothetical protein
MIVASGMKRSYMSYHAAGQFLTRYWKATVAFAFQYRAAGGLSNPTTYFHTVFMLIALQQYSEIRIHFM